MLTLAQNSPFEVRGFNMCESLLRHSPEELHTFLQRMKSLRFNSIIIHYDYGWRRYKELIMEECRKAGVEITLMVFGPRTFYSMVDWESRFFAKDENGTPFTPRPECETHPCFYEQDSADAFEEGATRFLQQLPREIRRVHMRAGDGNMFCRCPKCRNLSPAEQWQPFVARFIRAARRVRSDLKIETDIYLMRYELPRDCSVHAELDRIMFDPFPRHPHLPLNGQNVPPVHRELVKNMTDWCKRFPGKVYIHENAMKQGFLGVYRHAACANLEDLKLFRELGITGVCYEAYEPGYANFAQMFELLSRGLYGEKIEYELDEIEKWALRSAPGGWDLPAYLLLTNSCNEMDGRMLRLFFTSALGAHNVESFRSAADFLLENSDTVDWIYIGFMLCKWLRISGNIPKMDFLNLSPLAEDFCSRAKLWDFLEDLPEGTDIKDCCRNILLEARDKASLLS